MNAKPARLRIRLDVNGSVVPEAFLFGMIIQTATLTQREIK
jgi:hypothetical protein